MSGGQLDRRRLTHQHDPWGTLASHRESPAQTAVGHQHERCDDEEDRQVEPRHQVAVEQHEREALHGHTDTGRQQCPRQPRTHPESGLALVEPTEVVDDQVDRRGDRETDEIARQRIGVPVEAEAEPDEADHHHREIQRNAVEHDEEAESVIPEPSERSSDYTDAALDRWRERPRWRRGGSA